LIVIGVAAYAVIANTAIHSDIIVFFMQLSVC
jgi:hypothetical protein